AAASSQLDRRFKCIIGLGQLMWNDHECRSSVAVLRLPPLSRAFPRFPTLSYAFRRFPMPSPAILT
ncbi:MAG TPA: hypothetical protein VGR60_08645, partial [Gemmatimonadales bacterium]|nr:hypothetical protein [Gemmatimonadales bacterium]